MKVCTYLEGKDLFGRSGIGCGYKQLVKCLDESNIEHTTDLNSDYDILQIETIGPKSLKNMLKAKKAGKRVIVHTHTTAEDFRNSFRFSNILSKPLMYYLKFFYSRADALISPSHYTSELIGNGYGIKAKRYVISNGVDLEKFRFNEKKRKEYRSKYSLEGDCIYSVGLVFMRKGISDFVDVAKGLQNPFIWFGDKLNDAVIRDPNVDRVLDNLPQNVRFTGYVDDIIAAHSAGDIFFFPSYVENQGIVVLEAMAMGRPCVLRDLPVYSGWFNEGTEYLAANDNAGFKEKIRILTDDKKLRKKIVKNATRRLEKEHALDVVAKEYERVYEEVLG